MQNVSMVHVINNAHVINTIIASYIWLCIIIYLHGIPWKEG